MKKETKTAIVKALTKGPQTIKKISATTGMSYNTVSAALRELDAESDGFFPAEWKLSSAALAEYSSKGKMPGMPDARIAPTDPPLTVSYREIELYKLGTNKARIGHAIANLELTPETDRARLAEELATIARDFGSIAYRLTQAADDPAWFTTLGGNSPTEPE